MRVAVIIILILIACIFHVVFAHAATWNLSWTNNADGGVIEIERAPVASARCGTFANITTVNHPTATYQDTTAPSGFLCYRARACSTIDPGDGSPVINSCSPYSNVDATKPGRVQNVRVQAP